MKAMHESLDRMTRQIGSTVVRLTVSRDVEAALLDFIPKMTTGTTWVNLQSFSGIPVRVSEFLSSKRAFVELSDGTAYMHEFTDEQLGSVTLFLEALREEP